MTACTTRVLVFWFWTIAVASVAISSVQTLSHTLQGWDADNSHITSIEDARHIGMFVRDECRLALGGTIARG